MVCVYLDPTETVHTICCALPLPFSLSSHVCHWIRLSIIATHSNISEHLSGKLVCVCVSPKSNISFRDLCFFLRKSNLLQQSAPTTTGAFWGLRSSYPGFTRKCNNPAPVGISRLVHLKITWLFCRGRSSSNQAFMTLGSMLIFRSIHFL